MPNETLINDAFSQHPIIGILVVTATVLGLVSRAFFGARGKNSVYPEKDPVESRHEENKGSFREVKTMMEAAARNQERQKEMSDRQAEKERKEDRDRIEYLSERLEEKLDKVIADQIVIKTILNIRQS